MKFLISRRFLIISTAAIVLVLLAVFAGWYWYLQRAQQTLDTADAGRGLGEVLGGFPVGSAYNNITGAISDFFGGTISDSGDSSAEAAPQLWLAASAQTAGVTWTTENALPVLRFVDSGTGNVFDAKPSDSSVTRRSNTLRAKTLNAQWSGNGGIIFRSLGDYGVETFSAIIVKEVVATSTLSASAAQTLAAQNPGVLSGVSLPRGIISIAGKPDSNTIAYLAPYEGGSAVYLVNRDGSGSTRIWSSPLAQWHISWAGDHLLLVQNAANDMPGYAYDLSPSGNVTMRIAEVPGLSAIENAAGDILYSSASGGAVALAGVDSTNARITPPFRTLAEKCVWGSVNTSVVYCAVPKEMPAMPLPDAWYRGEVHTSDAIWKFDTKTGAVVNVYDPGDDTVSLDILSLSVDDSESYLGFIDAKTGSAWALRINQ